MAPTAQAQPLSAPPTTIERRFYPRIVPLAPICISIHDANQCLVINVSENGLLLSTRTGLPCNSVACIALPLDGLPKPVVVNIRVLWTNEIRRLAGIQILDVSDHDRQQIRKVGQLRLFDIVAPRRTTRAAAPTGSTSHRRAFPKDQRKNQGGVSIHSEVASQQFRSCTLSVHILFPLRHSRAISISHHSNNQVDHVLGRTLRGGSIHF